MAPKKMTIIASKGTLDMAYPPLILATTAAAMDMEVTIFFTFYGLEIIKKQNADRLKISPLGNPAMPDSSESGCAVIVSNSATS